MQIILILNVSFFGLSNTQIYAEDVNVPEWVLEIHDFWKKEQITDLELVNALKFLQNQKIIKLSFNPEYDITTNFLFTISIQSESELEKFSKCSDDWVVTGYYTPKEDDFSSDFILVDNIGLFRSDFVDVVKIEGWGRTLLNEFLGWYDNSFHLNDFPLDMHGNKLVFPTIAIDHTLFDDDDEIWIPTLPHPWNEVTFKANDVGPAIQGRHIDIFTGEGEAAQKMTEAITSFENTVCLKSR